MNASRSSLMFGCRGIFGLQCVLNYNWLLSANNLTNIARNHEMIDLGRNPKRSEKDFKLSFSKIMRLVGNVLMHTLRQKNNFRKRPYFAVGDKVCRYCFSSGVLENYVQLATYYVANVPLAKFWGTTQYLWTVGDIVCRQCYPSSGVLENWEMFLSSGNITPS